VSGPAFDPPSQSFGETSSWSRRDFLQLSFAVSGAIIAASLVGSGPTSYRVAALGKDPYTGTVLDSIRRIQNTEIVNLSDNHQPSDLIVIAASDLSDARLVKVAMNSAASVLIVTPVCRSIDDLAELKAARLRKGRFVRISTQQRLVPELISLPEMITDRLCESNRMPIAQRTEPARHQQRVLSGWAVWIDPVA
jgi:hypothetical protein